MVELLNDYGALCRLQGLFPRKVVLTFVPCGCRKTLQFIEWLGMDVPTHAEEFIFGPPKQAPGTAGGNGSGGGGGGGGGSDGKGSGGSAMPAQPAKRSATFAGCC